MRISFRCLPKEKNLVHKNFIEDEINIMIDSIGLRDSVSRVTVLVEKTPDCYSSRIFFHGEINFHVTVKGKSAKKSVFRMLDMVETKLARWSTPKKSKKKTATQAGNVVNIKSKSSFLGVSEAMQATPMFIRGTTI